MLSSGPSISPVAKPDEITPFLKSLSIEQETSAPGRDIGKFTVRFLPSKIEKFYEEVCLVDQVYIRDTKLKINDLLQALIAKIGENIKIRRFVRFQLGEPLD